MTGLNGDDPDDYYLNLNQDEESLLRSRHSVGSGAPHRQGSLVRPERSRLNNPDNPHFYYAQKTQEQMNHLDVLPSSTGVNPNATRRSGSLRSKGSVRSKFSGRETDSYLLQDMNTTDKKASVKISDEGVAEDEFDKDGDVDNFEESSMQPINKSIKPLRKETNDTLSFWQMYCYFITFWAPAPILAFCGMPKKERQMAWREKVALISVILYIGAIVAFLTFGFTKTVCSSSKLRLKNNEVSTEFVVVNGKAYELDTSSRSGIQDVEVDSDTLYGPWSDAGKDASFLFQNVNGNCHNLITPKSNSSIPHDDDNNLAWYFPCKLKNQDGSSKPNFTVENYAGWNCHTSKEDRDAFYGLKSKADVYFTWDGIKNSSRNLIVYNGDVLDLDLLDWLEKDDVDYPVVFDDLKTSNLQGYDLSLVLSNGHERKIARCLSEIIKVGEVDSKTVGCIASDVVLYVSLVFILSVVIIKFIIACYFRWTVARKQGAYIVDNKTMDKHTNDIEDWSNNIQTKAPLKEVDPHLRPKKYSKKSLGHKRASTFDLLKKHSSKMFQFNESVIDLDTSMSSSLQSSGSYRGMTTMTTQNAWKLSNENKAVHSRNPSTLLPTSSMFWNKATSSPVPGSSLIQSLDSTIIHPDIVQQPPLDFMPYGFPLIHTICFVTCYSEDEEGLRTTLDSLSTTDYPNSHKLLMVVCDGLIKGSGNDKTTPEIALGMMDDFVTPPDEVKPYSYVAVASGSKRHNMAKIYAGFYKYDDSTVPPENQQRVPIITIVKCGTPAEQGAAKPGNRGKRDSQIILMSFLEKITFDERMTQLEFQLLKNIWQITGLMADFYETVLMVDADTKVFPDALTHMVAEMVKDPLIMGLCGETKIANKAQSWVTAIQVFEYYISHHQAKAFESVFGSVTCLPGCFSMYRIKSPKGSDGYWVPVLANPDIVERYSDNVTNTLHKKNLLLLGEDRFLSSLMLKTFPKRKQVFVPKAACKTIAPDKFKVLLSQRRRWINSTVHNLFELVLIRDLCGTFCFSMQFVIGIELIGTMVLPLAICFTIYVIIFAIVSKPTPVITLVLLAIILGLPGLIVVITATRWSYLWWMCVYICALPIWNFVLPSYAYWKFDDFSWGDTRTIAGGNKKAQDENEGEFDHSKIKMRTWREFEREDILNRKEESDSLVA
ncbi:AIC_G0002090.mRNA.1.CDS.1 [Saccharomyces cerevisiae]|uniref:chitin synthase n=1 Tax=Saccharomyces pastorianus TaxID=27292 RepID=A0A6C1DN15_SACPS|nr:Chs3p [Saccharomyces cerevisiae YJM1574]AJQ01186.1 Chs3p [Saccharomyces cerevisiae YJM270]AJQ13028.1 Chs3p [Saccharomyces cerevisiae YJM1381]PTN17742.1 chitin synthase CHS3 [Saccharomyces cerevisiae]QID78030.1 Chitin synthase, class 3 [Saccharomyces pastorianus]